MLPALKKRKKKGLNPPSQITSQRFHLAGFNYQPFLCHDCWLYYTAIWEKIPGQKWEMLRAKIKFIKIQPTNDIESWIWSWATVVEGECYHQLACLPPQLLAMKYELTQPPENSFRFISCNIHHFCTHVDLKIPEPSLNANQNKSDKLNCFETYILQGQKSRKYHDHMLKTSGIIYIKCSLTSSKQKKVVNQEIVYREFQRWQPSSPQK